MAAPDDFPAPRQLVPGISPALEAAILRSLALPVNARFEDADAMRAALQGSAGTQVMPEPVVSEPAPVPSQRRLRSPWLWAGGAAVVLLLIAGGLWAAPFGFGGAPAPTATSRSLPTSTSAPAVTDATSTPKPTSTPTREATAAVSSPTPSPRPSATATDTPAPTVTPEPTATAEPVRRLQALSIEAVANGTQGFVAPPTGDLVLGDVPFRLTERIFQSQAEPAPHNTYPTRARLDVNVPQAEQLYLLLTTGNGFLDFAGSTIGRVVVECDGASSVLRELTLGQNVREWHSEPNVVASAPQAQQVWEGEIAGAGVLGHIDMLSLELPPACRSGALTAVEVLDESVAGTGSLDPALNLTGVSVAYYE